MRAMEVHPYPGPALFENFMGFQELFLQEVQWP